MMLRSLLTASLATALVFAGCDDEPTVVPTPDTTTVDNGSPDNGSPDNGGPDNGSPDNGTDDTKTETGGPETTPTDAQAETGNPDAQAETETTEPSKPEFCFEINQCLLDACPTPTQACIQAAFPGCTPDTATEAQAFQALNVCVQSNCAAFQNDQEALANCQLENCGSEQATCNAGTTTGTGTCAQLLGCQEGCLQGGSQDNSCLRDCYSNASVEALEAEFAVTICLSLECAATPTQACIQAAAAGACQAVLATCQTGATPDDTPDAADAGGSETSDAGGPETTTDEGPEATATTINGCLDDGSDADDQTGNATFALDPWTFGHQQCVKVSTGTAVSWNGSFSTHPLSGGPSGSADASSPISTVDQSGQTATVTFDTPGVYPYFCVIHPNMQGLIVVE